MKKFDEDAAVALRNWTEKEVRAASGTSPCSTNPDDNEYNPKGPHKWFIEAVADASAIITLRRIAEIWIVRPPYPSWRSYAPTIRQRADAMVLAATLPPGVKLADWFIQNEPLLQQDSANVWVVAVALLPLFEHEPGCDEAANWLDDHTHGTFSEYLANWCDCVPETHRPIVQRIAREFGLEIDPTRPFPSGNSPCGSS